MNLIRVFVMMIALAVAAFGAREAKAEVMGGVGTNLNYQLSSNGRTYEAIRPLSFRVGVRFSFADIYGEYSYAAKASAGSGTVEVGSMNHEFLAWVRKGDPTARLIKPFIALGVGTHYEVVTTKFAGDTSKDNGVMELLGAVAGGVQIRIMKNIEFSLEGRASFAESYSPNPAFGVGGYLNLLL